MQFATLKPSPSQRGSSLEGGLMLPNATTMIEVLPDALKRVCFDAEGKPHSCAITQSTSAPTLTDFGVTTYDGTDELFVAKPFSVPPSKRIRIQDADGHEDTRRIDSIVDNVIFLTLTLGEKARGV